MIDVYVSEEVFRYDADSLVKAFYPGREIKNHLLSNAGENTLRAEIYDENIRTVVIDIDDSSHLSKSELRNLLKKGIYEKLSHITGHELPWGCLTGVRPTRLALKLFREQGTREAAIEAMRGLYYVSEEKAALATDIAIRENEILYWIGRDKTELPSAGALPAGNVRRGRATPDRSVAPTELPSAGALPGYSLYIGIPFCPSRCTYCSFASYPVDIWKDRLDVYLEALGKELELVRELYGSISPSTLYIGGGTPTALDEETLDRLLDMVEDKINISDVMEYTVEAGRPDSITPEKLLCMKKHGVGRMCVNPQTMNDDTLRRIGRLHSAKDTCDAFAMARSAGFENINMDVILGLPQETVNEVRHTFEEIARLGPDDLTVHSLALKRGASLKEEMYGNSNSANTEETMAIASAAAEDMGLKPYYLYRQKNISGNFENTGYARRGKEGLYNIVIMEEVQSLIAVGAGTVSKYVSPDGRHISRCDTPKDIGQYLERIDEMLERKRVLFSHNML